MRRLPREGQRAAHPIMKSNKSKGKYQLKGNRQMKAQLFFLLMFCAALTCQRNIDDPNNIAATSWEEFINSGPIIGTNKIALIGPGKCNFPPYIVENDSFLIRIEESSAITDKITSIVLQVRTKSGDFEQAEALLHYPFALTALYNKRMYLRSATHSFSQNGVLESTMTNDSVAVRVREQNGRFNLQLAKIVSSAKSH